MTTAAWNAPPAAPAAVQPPCRTQDSCDTRLEAMRTRLETGEKELVRLDGEVRHLLRSLSAVTKALWAAATASFGVLLGFFIWYVESGI